MGGFVKGRASCNVIAKSLPSSVMSQIGQVFENPDV